MSTTRDVAGLPANDNDDELFDDLARRAGAALRRPAPEDGVRAIAQRRRHQQARKATVAGGFGMAALIGALLVVSTRDDPAGSSAVDTSPTPATFAAAIEASGVLTSPSP